MTHIYALIDPRTYKIRYIGKANKPNNRHNEHSSRFHENNHRTHWLVQLQNLGFRALLYVIEECNEFSWQERERYWIKYYRELGCDLVNATDGGEGLTNASQETKDKIRKAKIGTTKSEETKLKMSRSQKGRVITEDHKNKLSVAALGANNGASKLTDQDVLLMRGLFSEGINCPTVARIYGIHRSTVNGIKARKYWKHI